MANSHSAEHGPQSLICTAQSSNLFLWCSSEFTYVTRPDNQSFPYAPAASQTAEYSFKSSRLLFYIHFWLIWHPSSSPLLGTFSSWLANSIYVRKGLNNTASAWVIHYTTIILLNQLPCVCYRGLHICIHIHTDCVSLSYMYNIGRLKTRKEAHTQVRSLFPQLK